MNRIRLTAVGLLVGSLVAQDAAAQWNVARFGMDRNRMYVTAGLDPAVVTSLGYGRVVPLFGHDFQLIGEVGVAAARWDTHDFRARMGVRTSLARWRSLNLTGSAAFITRGTDNSIYRGLNFGSDFTGTLGVYRRGWFAAGEFGFDKAIITHVTLSDWYRRHFYPNARDGWYLNAGGTFHYGLTSGIAVGRVELAVRAGWLRTEKFDDVLPPLYAGVGLGFGF